MWRKCRLPVQKYVFSRATVRPSTTSYLLYREYYHSRTLLEIKPFILADIGEGIAEVELMSWYVKEGDEVKAFDKICEVQSDKATVEITSRYGGTITAVYGDEGSIIKVGETLVDIDTGSSAPIAPATNSTVTTPAPNPIVKASAKVTKPFVLADIGEGIAEVELMAWYVKVGDRVRAFDKICEVQSDKATVEITSRYDGVVTAIYGDEGGIIKVGETLVDIETDEIASDTSPHIATESSHQLPADSPVSGTTTSADISCNSEGVRRKVLTTPVVRKIAKENNIDLSTLFGSGPKGRILKGDVLKYLKTGYRGESAPSPQASSSGRPSAQPDLASTPVQQPIATTPSQSTSAPLMPPVRAVSGAAVDKKVPIRGIERMMVKSMTEALKVPHLTYAEEVVMDNLMTVRKELNTMLANSTPKDQKPLRMSFMPLMMKAASMALTMYPHLNATMNSEVTEVTHHGDHNFGVAMDTPKGLIVPVVKQVQNMSVVEIARELAYLQDCASRGTLTTEQMSGGTFTLSNIGSIGGTYMGPVIVVPQVVIGALGRFQTVPKYVHKSTGLLASSDDIYAGQSDGSVVVAPRTIMNVSWSADHRVVDGASVSR